MKKTFKIHLLNIADDLRKNWWVLLLSVLLGLMAAYIYENNGWSHSSRGEYSATVRIYDRNSQVSNIWSGNSAAKTASGNLKSVLENESLWESFVPEIPFHSLPKMTLSQQKESGLITISAQGSSPEHSYHAISALIAAYPDIAHYFNSISALEIIHFPDAVVQNGSGSGILYLIFPVISFLVISLFLIIFSASVNAIKKLSDIDELIPDSTGFQVKIDRESCLMLKNGIPLWLDNFTAQIQKEITSGRKIFLIASAEKSEVKSEIVSCLAQTLTRTGQKTAVVSCPALSKKKPSVFQQKSADVITSGNENVSKPLSYTLSSDGEEGEAMVKKVAESVDCVLWDYPAMCNISVVDRLPDVADSVLFVIDSDLSSAKRFSSAVAFTALCDKKIVGNILCCVRNRFLYADSKEVTVR